MKDGDSGWLRNPAIEESALEIDRVVIDCGFQKIIEDLGINLADIASLEALGNSVPPCYICTIVPHHHARRKYHQLQQREFSMDWMNAAKMASIPLASGEGHSEYMEVNVKHGFSLIKGSRHDMEDFHVAEFKRVESHELGLFAIFDGHGRQGHSVPQYLQRELFGNILHQPGFWDDPIKSIMDAYRRTDSTILEKTAFPGGSTAVTAILIDGCWLLVANVGDSRAVLCRNGLAVQLSTDHAPRNERELVESKGGFVTERPMDESRVDGRLAVSRAFGDRTLKEHLSSDPDIRDEVIGNNDEFLILASDGVWKVMTNQQAIDLVRHIKDPKAAAEMLTDAAVEKGSQDDVSCIIVRL